MRKFIQASASILVTLALSVGMVTAITSQTLAATASPAEPVATGYGGDDNQGSTNHCTEFDNNPDEEWVFDGKCEVYLYQPTVSDAVTIYTMTRKGETFNLWFNQFPKSDEPYEFQLFLTDNANDTEPTRWIAAENGKNFSFTHKSDGYVSIEYNCITDEVRTGGYLSDLHSDNDISERYRTSQDVTYPTGESVTYPTRPMTEPVTYPTTEYPETMEFFTKLALYQPTVSQTDIKMYDMKLINKDYIVSLELKESYIPYECKPAIYSCIFPADPPTYPEGRNKRFYVDRDCTVDFIYHTRTGEFDIRSADITEAMGKYSLPDIEEPTTVPQGVTYPTTEPQSVTYPTSEPQPVTYPTTEPPEELSEMLCSLALYQPEIDRTAVGLHSMEQKGWDFTLVEYLYPSDKPYECKPAISSKIFPANPPAYPEGMNQAFIVFQYSPVYFTYHTKTGVLDIRGNGILMKTPKYSLPENTEQVTTEPRVTYPTSEPVYTTEPGVTYPTSEPVYTTSPVEKPVLYGDANLDGVISIEDVTYIQLAIVESVTLSNRARADVNLDGKVDITDCTCVQMYIAEFKQGTGVTGKTAN